MPTSFRKERLNELIKEVISEILLGGMKDPRIGFVTITSVVVSRDVTSAKVHFSVMGDEQARLDSEAGLKSARNFLRTAVGRELKLRNAPELRFYYDDTLDRSLELEQKLKEIHEDDAKHEEPE